MWIYLSGLFWWKLKGLFDTFIRFIRFERKMEPLAAANIASKKKFNFEHAFRPIRYFSRFAGLWPFSIVHNSTGTIQRTRIGPLNILSSILIIIWNLTLSLESYGKLRASHESHAVHIRFVVFSAFQISFALFTTIRISMDLINRNQLIDILGKFNTFDDEVRFFF